MRNFRVTCSTDRVVRRIGGRYYLTPYTPMKQVITFYLLLGLIALTSLANAQTATAQTADSTALKAYAGTYTFESGSPVQKFTVTVDKGSLYGEADTMGKNKLVKQDKADTFQSTSSYGSVLTFNRDVTTKAVTSFSMAIQGATLLATKDKP